MAAKLKLEGVSSRVARPNMRRVARVFSQSEVAIRSHQGDRNEARLRDVSIFGCSIKSDAEWMRGGIFLSIELARNWTVQAVVRWCRDGIAGVEFLRPISEADSLAIAGDS